MSDLDTDQAIVEAKGWLAIAADLERRLTDVEAEKARLRAALEQIVRAGTWTGSDEQVYTSKEGRIARDVLKAAHP